MLFGMWPIVRSVKPSGLPTWEIKPGNYDQTREGLHIAKCGFCLSGFFQSYQAACGLVSAQYSGRNSLT